MIRTSAKVKAVQVQEILLFCHHLEENTNPLLNLKKWVRGEIRHSLDTLQSKYGFDTSSGKGADFP